MRRLASTIALVVVLAGLGAYIYFYLWKQPADDSASKQEKVFSSVEYDKLGELKVKSKTGEVTTLKKAADGWQIVAPTQAKGMESDIASVGAAVSNMEITRVIEDKPADLKPYGLDTPLIELDYKTSDGKGSGRLLVGHQTSTGAGLYAKRNDEPRVFLIPSYYEPILNKSTFDLRDKTLLSFQRDKVDGIEVDADSKTIQIAKDGADWKLTKPLADRADSSAVSGLLDRLETAQMKSIAGTDPTPADLKKYGFDKPAVTVTLNQGSARATFLIGGKADDATVYARDAAKPIVVTVDKMLVDDLKKGVDDYRRKDVFDMRPFNAAHVEFNRKGQTVAFDRIKGEKDAPDKWRRVSPNPADADKSKVETMLGAFADLRVASFADSKAKTGLESPAMVVDAKFGDDNKQEKVTFGQTGSDTYVARSGESGAGKIDTDSYNNAIKLLDELVK